MAKILTKRPTKNATDQSTAVAPGHKLCNNTHTNQEYRWTIMTTRAVLNHMTAEKATERTKKTLNTSIRPIH